MKKNKALIMAASTVAITGMLTGCSFRSSSNFQPAVYGSPDVVIETPGNDAPEVEKFDPEENRHPCVYGPPERVGGVQSDDDE